jgi:pimeloyl-ACP methyl ester carboxylesterase
MRVFVPEHKKNDNSKHYQESLHNLKEAGALGLTAGLSDRARRILQETQPQNIGAIQTIAIASSDDDTYVNPKNQSTALNSAERIKNLSLHPRSEVRVLENAGHAALVENPEPYDTTIQQALQTFGRKKLQ